MMEMGIGIITFLEPFSFLLRQVEGFLRRNNSISRFEQIQNYFNKEVDIMIQVIQ